MFCVHSPFSYVHRYVRISNTKHTGHLLPYLPSSPFPYFPFPLLLHLISGLLAQLFSLVGDSLFAAENRNGCLQRSGLLLPSVLRLPHCPSRLSPLFRALKSSL